MNKKQDIKPDSVVIYYGPDATTATGQHLPTIGGSKNLTTAVELLMDCQCSQCKATLSTFQDKTKISILYYQDDAFKTLKGSIRLTVLTDLDRAVITITGRDLAEVENLNNVSFDRYKCLHLKHYKNRHLGTMQHIAVSARSIMNYLDVIDINRSQIKRCSDRIKKLFD
jgi:hypothetical protein